jgi:hypothetical protein
MAKKTPVKKVAKAPPPLPVSPRKGKPTLTGSPGRTPARVVGRVGDEQWKRWKAAAKEQESNFSEWVRRLLDYAAQNPAIFKKTKPCPGHTPLQKSSTV